MNDLKYRVEELELDGDDLRRRVDKLTKDVERCEARLPDVDELAEKDNLERLEYRVDKLEGDDFVDPGEFDDLVWRVRKLEEADRRVQLEARRFETSGSGDSNVGDPETTVLRAPDDFVELAEFDDLKRRVDRTGGDGNERTPPPRPLRRPRRLATRARRLRRRPTRRDSASGRERVRRRRRPMRPRL